MGEYKLSKYWVISIYVLAPILISLFCSILIMPSIVYKIETLSYYNLYFIYPITLVMIIFITFVLLEVVNSTLIIEPGKITKLSAFNKEQLMFNEIRGYRLTEYFLIVESNIDQIKNIKITIYFENWKDILKWVSENFTDLDLIQPINHLEEMYNNFDIDLSIEQREIKLKNAWTTARIINISGGLIAAWILYWPNPFEYAFTISIGFLLICIILLKYFKGFIRIHEKNNYGLPTIIGVIFAIPMAVGFSVTRIFDILSYTNMWFPGIFFAFILTAALTIGNNQFSSYRSEVFSYISLLFFFMLIFGLAQVVALNCILDKSKPEIFNSIILNERRDSHKGEYHYYLELSPWGPQKEIEEVSVSKRFYLNHNKNDTVNIYFHRGKFDIPWFEVKNRNSYYPH